MNAPKTEETRKRLSDEEVLRRDTETPPEDVVDEASDESFPASDPPAWTETAASRNSRPKISGGKKDA